MMKVRQRWTNQATLTVNKIQITRTIIEEIGDTNKQQSTNGLDVDGKFTGGDMPRINFKIAFSMSQSNVNINVNQLPLPLVSTNSKQKPQEMMIRVVTHEAGDVETAEEDNNIGYNNTHNNNNNNICNSTNKKNRCQYEGDDASCISDAGADADGNLSPRLANEFYYSFGTNNSESNSDDDNNINNSDSGNPNRYSRNLVPQVKRQHSPDRSSNDSVELSIGNSRPKSGGSVFGISRYLG